MLSLVKTIRSWFGLIHKCERCGRELHERKSIAHGMGPECWRAYRGELKKGIEDIPQTISISDKGHPIAPVSVPPWDVSFIKEKEEKCVQ